MTKRDGIIDLVDQEEWEILLKSSQEGPYLTLTLPTIRKGQETLQNPVRLKNLLREAEPMLAERLSSSEAEKWLEPAWDLQRAFDYQQHQAEGLALFRSRNHFAAYRVPFTLGEEIHLGSRFFVRPLLPLWDGGKRFWVLSLDASGVTLYRGGRYGLEEIDLGDTPTSLEDLTVYEEEEKSLQFHSGTGDRGPGETRPAIFHGQGAAGDEDRQKEKTLEFFRQLDSGVQRVLGAESAPLVLVGEETDRGLYREASKLRNRHDSDVAVHPRSLTRQEIHARAMGVLEPGFHSEERAALDRLAGLAGKNDPRAARGIETVVPAAMNSRVDTLFVAPESRVWGCSSEDGTEVTVTGVQGKGNEELVNLAVVPTLENGGEVVVTEEELPGREAAAAILRF
ncbi:MAG: hypothetical protein R6T96_11775 [Longimicrobiales bacterium]